VDRGPWYRWAFERLGLEYRYERFGMRNRVERFFRYLKERTIVFHHKLSTRNHIQGINNLKLFLNLFTELVSKLFKLLLSMVSYGVS